MSGGDTTTLVLQDVADGVAVGWPGAPGDPDFFTHQLAVYANDTEATVPVLAHAAFGVDVAAQLDVLSAPLEHLRRDGDATVFAWPQREAPAMASFFTSPTRVDVIGVAYDDAALRALDPTADVSESERWRRQCALSNAALLREMASDRKVSVTPVAGFPQAVAVAGVVICVAGLIAWMRSNERIAAIEADASVRREREIRAAASRDAAERIRQTVASTPTGQSVDWSRMPPPTANEAAAREAVHHAAQSEWDRVARGISQASSSVASLALTVGAIWLGIQLVTR